MYNMNDMPPKNHQTTQAIHLLLENELLEQIEDFRFKNRFHTRIETIKALLKLGLQGGKNAKLKDKAGL
jgi:hypothetical protein